MDRLWNHKVSELKKVKDYAQSENERVAHAEGIMSKRQARKSTTRAKQATTQKDFRDPLPMALQNSISHACRCPELGGNCESRQSKLGGTASFCINF